MGMCGYFECAQELDLQCRELSLKSPRLVCAVGSLGTYMGLYCGLQEIESDLRLTGIAISPFEEEKEQRLFDVLCSGLPSHGPKTEKEPCFQIEKGYTRADITIHVKKCGRRFIGWRAGRQFCSILAIQARRSLGCWK